MDDLLSFLNDSPTAWHAVENLSTLFKKHEFIELDESSSWNINPEQGYFVTRNGSSLIAFITPKKSPQAAYICASHTDSPALKLKPHAPFLREDTLMLGVDVYGSPLLNSWLNRELGIAGRVVTLNKKKQLQEKLINVRHAPVVIPQLAIHLDREVNKNGVILNPQDHLAALATIDYPKTMAPDSYLKNLLNIDPILSNDLFLYPLEKAAYVGLTNELLAGYRIDSLASVHAIVKSLLNQQEPFSHTLKMGVFWDNEEIGSATPQGATSPFFSNILELILLGLGLDRKNYLQTLSSSLCVSIDLAHAWHPSYASKHEPQHPTQLGKGIVIKHSAQHKYASDARTVGYLKALCHRYQIAYQEGISRADMISGSTIGPLHAHVTGIPTVDIGCPQLSMHSARELMALKDQEEMIVLLNAFYKEEN